MSRIEIIVAAGRDNAIGRRGDLAFHIREDLRRFKSLTMGHPVIMGRKTFESLPKGALPGRRNIVITSQPDYTAPGAEVAHSVDEALGMCRDAEVTFIIGGASIYAQALPLADTIHLTRIDADSPDADTFFPEMDVRAWTETPEAPLATDPSGLPYLFVTLRRK